MCDRFAPIESMTRAELETELTRLRKRAGWLEHKAEAGEREAERVREDQAFAERMVPSVTLEQVQAERDGLRAEVERLTKELEEESKRVIAVMVCHAILGDEWLHEQMDAEKRPAWADAVDMVRKLKGERDAEKARAEKAEARHAGAVALLRRIADHCAAEDSHDLSRDERRQAMRRFRDEARTFLAACDRQGEGK